MMTMSCGSCGKPVLWFSKERWARSVRPQLRQLPQGRVSLRMALAPVGCGRRGRMSSLEHEGCLVVQRGVAPPRIVEALDEVEEAKPRVARSGEPHPFEQLAFERCKEALTHRIVVTVAHRAHRWPDARLATARAEADRRVLTALV